MFEREVRAVETVWVVVVTLEGRRENLGDEAECGGRRESSVPSPQFQVTAAGAFARCRVRDAEFSRYGAASAQVESVESTLVLGCHQQAWQGTA